MPMLIGLGLFCTKADASCLWQWIGIHELLDCFDQGQYLLIVIRELAFKFSDSASKLSVTRDDLTQLDESPDNKDADIYSPGRVENGGRHNGAMLSECERKGLRELQLFTTGHFFLRGPHLGRDFFPLLWNIQAKTPQTQTCIEEK